MANAVWVSKTQNIIYSTVKKRANDVLVSRFPNILFTSDGSSLNTAQFPAVYIHPLGFAEMSKTLNGTTINAFQCGYQIDVTVNKSLYAKSSDLEVIWEVIEQFKKLRFEMVMSPTPVSTGSDDTRQLTATVKRLVSYNDVIG